MELDTDWYTYLTEDFKRHRHNYASKDRGVFDCPRCGKTKDLRIDNVKIKIKKLGYYKCTQCCRNDALKNARAERWNKK